MPAGFHVTPVNPDPEDTAGFVQKEWVHRRATFQHAMEHVTCSNGASNFFLLFLASDPIRMQIYRNVGKPKALGIGIGQNQIGLAVSVGFPDQLLYTHTHTQILIYI